jgi:hypothetical protein
MSASCPACHHLHPTGNRCGSPALPDSFDQTESNPNPASILIRIEALYMEYLGIKCRGGGALPPRKTYFPVPPPSRCVACVTAAPALSAAATIAVSAISCCVAPAASAAFR